MTPIRRLEGVVYWVIDDPSDIGDFIRTVLRKEWEGDLRSEGKDPSHNSWLADLLRRRWELGVLKTLEVEPDMEWVTPEFLASERLGQRRAELRRTIEYGGAVIWPIVARAEGYKLADGYCRYTALKEMGVPRLYAYVGSV